MAWRAGDRVAAASAVCEGLEGYARLSHRWGMALGLTAAAALADLDGDAERSTFLLAAAQALREEVGVALLPFVSEIIDELQERAAKTLDPSTLDRAHQAGRSAPIGRVVAQVLQQASG
jgi:hypothetical protein